MKESTPAEMDRDASRPKGLASVIAPKVRPHARLLIPLADSLVWIPAAMVAVVLEADSFQGLPFGAVLRFGAMAIAMNLVVGYGAGLYQGRRRIGSLEELEVLAAHMVVVTLLVAMVNNAIPGGRLVDLGVVVGTAAAAMLGYGATRMAWRRLFQASVGSTHSKERVVVFGAGDSGAMAISAMIEDPGRTLIPVAVLDDDSRRSRLRIRGVRVMGTRHDLADVARRTGATILLVTDVDSATTDLPDLVRRAEIVPLEVKVLPPASELFEALAVDDIREVTNEELLGRRAIETDFDLSRSSIAGRVVLVTGAGGSIGSELCRQVHQLGPRTLVMLDRDESALHALQLSIDGRALLDSRSLVVACIRDRDRLEEVFAEWSPDVVFHAAALKHLPLLEMHPVEGVKTNVIGTLNVLDVAARHGVERFVNISTDKAADPLNVLGYTKRVAERLTAHYAATKPGVYVSVRFGNVLGSRGSVLTAFRSQIAQGGPVTVTHPDVERYFMTVEEAVGLVIQAGAIGRDGEVLVLDMGEPVRIDDVARRLVAVSGSDVEIVYTGLRRGEKLSEQLLGSGEADHRPSHPLISQVPVPAVDPTALVELQASSDPVAFLMTLCSNHARSWTPAEAGLGSIDLDDEVIDLSPGSGSDLEGSSLA